jgi:hypothetical protein
MKNIGQLLYADFFKLSQAPFEWHLKNTQKWCFPTQWEEAIA